MISTEDLAWKEMLALRDARNKPYEPDRSIKIPSVTDLKKLKTSLTKEQKELSAHIQGIEEGIKNIEVEIEGLQGQLATSGKTFKDAVKLPEIEKALELSQKKLSSAQWILEGNRETSKGLEERLETIDDEIAAEEEYQTQYAEVEERWRERLNGYDELTFREIIKQIAPIENELIIFMNMQERFYELASLVKDAKYPNFNQGAGGRWDRVGFPSGIMIVIENGRFVKERYESSSKKSIEIRTTPEASTQSS